MDDGEQPNWERISTGSVLGAYGVLLVVILLHVLVRWIIRRKKLSSHVSHVPGDKSFKSKLMRELITRDFQAIQNLTSDVRLIDASLPPSVFGKQDELPEHWHRMKAFDAAAEFVASHVHLLGDTHPPPSPAFSLPLFLERLQRHSLLPLEQTDIVSRVSELYKISRYRKTDFTAEMHEELLSILHKLELFLSQRYRLSSLSHPFSPTSGAMATSMPLEEVVAQPCLTAKVPGEPLLAGTAVRRAPAGPRKEPHLQKASSLSTPSKKGSGGHRLPDLELKPLVSYGEHQSTETTPASIVTPTSHSMIPGTPV